MRVTHQDARLPAEVLEHRIDHDLVLDQPDQELPRIIHPLRLRCDSGIRILGVWCRDPGFRFSIRDSVSGFRDALSGIQNLGFGIRVSGCRIGVSGFGIRDSELPPDGTRRGARSSSTCPSCAAPPAGETLLRRSPRPDFGFALYYDDYDSMSTITMLCSKITMIPYQRLISGSGFGIGG